MGRTDEDIFGVAVRLPPGARDAYLREVCGANTHRRADIDELLHLHDLYPEPDERDDAGGSEAEDRFPAAVGAFRLERELGRGGMGRVFLSRDLALDRPVAVKVLPPHLSDDPCRARRFEREARILAALEHPNIAAVYRFDRDHGRPYFVMEYLEGETLRGRLERGPLTYDETRNICLQAAEGLAAAHRAGIVHRDLKPSNVLTTTDGRVKVVDFGVAKVLDDDIESDATVTGGLLGSPGYAAPEQLRGEPADPRSDAWSFGCILFECLAGRPAFPGRTAIDRLHAVLTQEPDWNALPPDLPRGVRWLLERCITRDTSARIHDFSAIADILCDGATSRVAMEIPPPAPAPAPQAAPVRAERAGGRARVGPWALSAAVLAGVALVLLVLRPAGPGPGDALIPKERQITFQGDVRLAEISPDGRTVALVVDGRSLELLDIETGERTILSRMGRIGRPTWSTGSEELVFVGDEAHGSGSLRSYVADRRTGNVRTVGPRSFRGTAPTADGSRIVGYTFRPGTTQALTILDRATGEMHALRLPFDFMRPPRVSCSPVADVILCSGHTPDGEAPAFWTYSLVDGRAQRIVEKPGVADPVWSPDGTSIVYRDGERLASLPVDAKTGAPTGEPRVILARYGGGPFSVAGSSRALSVAHVTGYKAINLWAADAETPAWDTHEPWRRVTNGTFQDKYCRLDAQGDEVVFVRLRGERQDVYRLTIGEDEPSRLTYSQTGKAWAAWSPDGEEIAYAEQYVGIRVMDRDGDDDRCVVPLQAASYVYWPWQDRVMFQRERDRDRNYHFLDLDTSVRAPLFPTLDGGTVFQASISPDGARLAVAGNRGFDEDLHVWLVDLDDRSERRLYPGWAAPFAWSPDAEWVYLITDDPAYKTGGASVLLRVHVQTGETERLLDCPGHAAGWSSVTMSADGRRIVCAIRNTEMDAWLIQDVAS